ncbi:Large neutral amino acids transporter small subunit 1 [Lamellibrachia satsuma]|nr:Large neutral amino acids transporter small subunit 1 [Lamellibrachia satsuma]
MTGVIIGSGIFVSPVSIIAQCQSVGLSLVVWAVSGVLTMFVVLSYTELAGMFPKAGGEYAYTMAVLGPLPAFLIAWVNLVIVNPSACAVLALTTTNYLFKPIFPDCALPFAAQKLFSVWIVVTVVVLNSCYVRYVTRVQIFLTAAKMAALSLIIVSGTIHIAKGNHTNFTDPFEGSTTDPAAIAVALYSGMFTYGGW